MKNQYDVEALDLLPGEYDKPIGERLTKFKCTICNINLNEAELSSIRWATAPLTHYKCLFPK